MGSTVNHTAKERLALTLDRAPRNAKPLSSKMTALVLAAATGLFAVPSASLAVVGLSSDSAGGVSSSTFDFFTPASVDPDLAARVAEKSRERGIGFTPVGTTIIDAERSVTVAIRVDEDLANSLSARGVADAAPGLGSRVSGLQASRFNLGTARGYQSFARQQSQASSLGNGLSLSDRAQRLDGVSNLSMPDLADFEPSRTSRSDEPSRLQPRIELGDEAIAGRSPNTLDAIGSQVLDVGGAFRLSPNLDVTAGVRYSQERERLDPLTNSVQDSQAVYVGTQIRF